MLFLRLSIIFVCPQKSNCSETARLTLPGAFLPRGNEVKLVRGCQVMNNLAWKSNFMVSKKRCPSQKTNYIVE